MASQKNTQIIRWTVILSSFIIVALILWNTYDFFQKFKHEERAKMEILAKAYERFSSASTPAPTFPPPAQRASTPIKAPRQATAPVRT